MEEMHLRPALRPYVWICAGFIAIFFLLAFAVGLLSPGLLPIALGISIILTALVLIRFLHLCIVHFSNEYTVTDGEITRVAGIWAKNEYHVPIDKIEDYKVSRSFFGKLIGVADIGIQTARAERGLRWSCSPCWKRTRQTWTSCLRRSRTSKRLEEPFAFVVVALIARADPAYKKIEKESTKASRKPL